MDALCKSIIVLISALSLIFINCGKDSVTNNYDDNVEGTWTITLHLDNQQMTLEAELTQTGNR